MPTLDQWKEELSSGTVVFAGQDELPLDSLRIFIVLNQNANLDPQEMALRMRLAGVYVMPLPRISDMPNIYTFVGLVNPLEIAGPDGYKTISMTPETIEEILPADVVLVSKFEMPDGEHAEQIIELQAALEVVRKARTSGTKVYTGHSRISPNQWTILRVVSRTNRPPLRTEQVRDLLLAAGYAAWTPDTGLLGILTPASEWAKGNWTEVLFNPLDRIVTVKDLYNIFPADLVAAIDPVGLYDVEFLRDHQEIIDFFFKAQRLEVATTGAGGDLRDVLTDILEDSGKVFGALRYVVWGAVGVGALWLGKRAYAILAKPTKGLR